MTCLCVDAEFTTLTDGTPMVLCDDALMTLPLGVGLSTSYTFAKFADDVFAFTTDSDTQNVGLCTVGHVMGGNPTVTEWTGFTASAGCRNGHSFIMYSRKTTLGPVFTTNPAFTFQAHCDIASPPALPPPPSPPPPMPPEPPSPPPCGDTQPDPGTGTSGTLLQLFEPTYRTHPNLAPASCVRY